MIDIHVNKMFNLTLGQGQIYNFVKKKLFWLYIMNNSSDLDDIFTHGKY